VNLARPGSLTLARAAAVSDKPFYDPGNQRLTT
jgi:hypothetical protein